MPLTNEMSTEHKFSVIVDAMGRMNNEIKSVDGDLQKLKADYQAGWANLQNELNRV